MMRGKRLLFGGQVRAAALLIAVMAVGGATSVVAAGGGTSRLDDDGAIDAAFDVHGMHHHKHGGTDGHLAPTAENVRLVGRMRINQDQTGRASDVGVLGNHAYIGAYYEPRCQKGGVYVFDISTPSAPKQINFIRTANESYVGEGVQTVHLDTPAFVGDVLVLNNEICGKSNTGAKGGISLVDVTKPKTHKYLAEGVGDFEPAGFYGPGIAHTVHSAFLWDAGDKAYAVLVDNEEGADVDILDITDPRKPQLIAEHDLVELFPQIAQEGFNEIWHHDVVVRQVGDRWEMLVSYWDAGYVVLDVTDPTAPQYIADSDYAVVDPELLESTGEARKDEGNGHEAEWTRDGEHIVAADEDFAPYVTTATNLDDGSEIENAELGSNMEPLEPGEVLEGDAVYVGRACPGDDAVPAPTAPDQIAVIERGVCFFDEKVAAVDAVGGYVGAIVFDREGADGCESLITMSATGETPTFGVVPREQGFAIFGAEGAYDEAACLAGNGTVTAPIEVGAVGDRVRIESAFDGWGYVRLFRNEPGKLTLLDTYAIPEAHDRAYAAGFGDLSVHEAAVSHVRDDLVYFAYYAGGFRVAKIVDDELVEVGRYIDAGGNNFWGVQVWSHGGKEYVLASDRDYGLYIFEYTGP